MKKVRMLWLALLLILTKGVLAAEEPTVIYGSCMYTESSEMSWGIYSFPATGETAFTPVWVSGDLMANGGAVYANGKYYVVSYLDLGGGMAIAAFLTCDVEKQEMDYIQIMDWNYSYITTDMTYDPQTGNIYGCSLNEDGSGAFALSILDTQTGKQQKVADMEQMCALAADGEGQLYGIGAKDGVLYRIDKTTAELTAVGETGVMPQSTQSATFDLDSGVMYWSAYTETGGALYTVNTETGLATLVSEYPDMTQITGIYTLRGANSEPTAAEEVTLNFEAGSLTGTVDFRMPQLDADGNTLEGELDYTVSVDNVEYASGQAQPGAQVSVPVTLENAGNYYFTVSVKNTSGAAPAVNLTRFVGVDTPKKVENIQIENQDGLVSLTWELPETGVHEGYIDREKVTYRVVRRPENVVVAEGLDTENFSETVVPEGMAVCFYAVYAELNGAESEEAVSEHVVLGDNLEVPVDESLKDSCRFLLFSVIDGNADRATWRYDAERKAAVYEWAYGDANDDWLVSPPIRLEAGKEYRMTCDLYSEADTYAADVEFVLGNGPEADDLNTVVMENRTVDQAECAEFTSDAFAVEADGLYHLGIHVLGKRSIYYLYAERFAVEEVPGSSIEGMETAETDIRIVGREGGVSVWNPEKALVRIYDVTGVLVYEGDGACMEIGLTKGIYILKAGQYTRKFAV